MMTAEPSLSFTRPERIRNALLLHSSRTGDCNFGQGKTGILLYFYLHARHSGEQRWENYADRLLDDITEQLHLHMPVDFSEGLCGIGWTIEYLIRHGFVEAVADEVLGEFDKRILNALIFQPNHLQKLTDIGHYCCYRIAGRADSDEAAVLQIKHYLIHLIDEIERLLSAPDKPDFFPDTLSTDFDFTWNYPWLLDLVCRLHKIKVYPHKTDKILRHLLTAFSATSFSALHPANRMLLYTVFQRHQLTLPGGEPDKELPVLHSPYVKDGWAGYLLLLQFLPSGHLYRQQIPLIRQKLQDFPETASPYAGFPLPSSSTASPLGLLEGITGIGIAWEYSTDNNCRFY